MRALPARRIASSALCATLLVGIGAPAALAADSDSARDRVHVVSSAPVPAAEALLAQVKHLADAGGVLTPVSDLLNAVLKADNGRLTAAEAKALGGNVKATIAKAAQGTAATPSTAAPMTSMLQNLPKTATRDDAKAARDLEDDALAALQSAVDTLLAAAQSGDVSGVDPAVTGVVNALVNVLAATLSGSGLPAANLPGLPTLPKPPALPVPGVPTTPTLPTTGLSTS